MKKLILLFICFGLIGCEDYVGHQEYSGVLKEPGEIISISYKPEMNTSGAGFSTRGDLVFTSYHEDEQYIVIIRTAHGTFIKDSKELWSLVRPSQKINVLYRESYKVYEQKGKEFQGLDFLNVEIDGKNVWQENRWN